MTSPDGLCGGGGDVVYIVFGRAHRLSSSRLLSVVVSTSDFDDEEQLLESWVRGEAYRPVLISSIDSPTSVIPVPERPEVTFLFAALPSIVILVMSCHFFFGSLS